MNVEGVNYWTSTALGVNRFLAMTKTVAVSDGKLTIDQGGGSEMATRICYVEITQSGVTQP